MRNKRSLFLVGLFVCCGIVITVAAFIWLGASKYFEKGRDYVTYFDESVQGLQVDSRVKYRGVDIGSVKRIKVAPDNRLVEVLLKVDLPSVVGSDIVSQLKSAGITGIVFIELDRRIQGDEVFYPPEEMRGDYPVIPSQPSQTKQMLSNVDKIMSRMEKVDLAGVAERLKITSISIEKFFSAGLILEDRVIEAVSSLNSVTKKTEKAIEDALIPELTGEAKKSLSDAQAVMADLKKGVIEANRLITMIQKEVEVINSEEVSGNLRSAIASIELQTRHLSSEIEATNEDIRRTSESLRMLVTRLYESPSDILFGNRLP